MKKRFENIESIEILPLEDIYKAQRVAPLEIQNTPLIKLNLEVPGKEIYLKLESLQPVGSFKVRGAYNAIYNLDKTKYTSVTTASTGNFAQSLAWSANKHGVECTVVCPNNIPQIKSERIKALGAKLVKVPFDEFWEIVQCGFTDKGSGKFVHPCSEYDAIAGNGVMALEMVNQLEDFDTVICPYGGGSNLLGIASALKQLRPNVKAYACEVDVAAPLHASLKAGCPAKVKDWQPTFVDGLNAKNLIPSVWKMVHNLVEDSILVDTKEISDAMRLLAVENKLVTEGAGAATVAAALTDRVPPGKIICMISGGNIDTSKLVTVLNGGIP